MTHEVWTSTHFLCHFFCRCLPPNSFPLKINRLLINTFAFLFVGVELQIILKAWHSIQLKILLMETVPVGRCLSGMPPVSRPLEGAGPPRWGSGCHVSAQMSCLPGLPSVLQPHRCFEGKIQEAPQALGPCCEDS